MQAYLVALRQWGPRFGAVLGLTPSHSLATQIFYPTRQADRQSTRQTLKCAQKHTLRSRSNVVPSTIIRGL